jgi:hypothetical protein
MSVQTALAEQSFSAGLAHSSTFGHVMKLHSHTGVGVVVVVVLVVEVYVRVVELLAVLFEVPPELASPPSPPSLTSSPLTSPSS